MEEFFILKNTDLQARYGELRTSNGIIKTPVFMNVATQAAIKGGLDANDLEKLNCQIALCNTYHLHIRPGENLIDQFDGLHNFMKWSKPIITDSGGFQIFSLSKFRKIHDEGVIFSSHVDGKKIFIGPKESMNIQFKLGANIIMAFDECVKNPSSFEYNNIACNRTNKWLLECIKQLNLLKNKYPNKNKKSVLFGINQGGLYLDLRKENIKIILEHDLPGYAIGGLSVGEENQQMYYIVENIINYIPKNKPRYLMGVGTPIDIIECVERGIDMFDCVMPSRNARHGKIFTWNGIINIYNKKYANCETPYDINCKCYTCQNFSIAYLRHLFKAKEMLAARLSVIHNLYFYNDLMSQIRLSIKNNQFKKFKNSFYDKLSNKL